MRLFDRSASKLAAGPTLALPSDPGPGLFDEARRYDPGVRYSKPLRRLIFSNGVLLLGPVKVTPAVAQEAGLPEGTSVAWYALAALQGHQERRVHDAKAFDGELLVRGLAARLGGTTHPALLQPKLALLASVYSEQGLPTEQVIEALRPYGGDFRVEDQKPDSYSLTGEKAHFYVAYWSPRRYRESDAPAALGPMRPGRLHHWDLHGGVPASDAPRELGLKVGEAALALADQSGGRALDMFGSPISTPDDLVPR
jgi:hypothetical protein